VRLGTDTPADEHSVLLGLVAGCGAAGVAGAHVFQREMAPLFC